MYDHIALSKSRLHIERHVAHQECVFAFDHLRAGFVAHGRELTQRNLHAAGCRNKNPVEGFDLVT